MAFSKRSIRRVLSTWPQRLAISGVVGFIVWSITEEELLVFLSVTLITHAFLTYYHSRIREVKPRLNEEMRY